VNTFSKAMHIYAFTMIYWHSLTDILHSSYVESHMCISDITCVKNSHVLVSENTLIKRSNWMQVYFAHAQYAPDRVPLRLPCHLVKFWICRPHARIGLHVIIVSQHNYKQGHANSNKPSFISIVNLCVHPHVNQPHKTPNEARTCE